MSIYEEMFKPMLLKEVSKPFNSDNHIFEVKFDGIRCLIYVEPNKILIQNRKGNNMDKMYPELLSIKDMVKNKVIFDGEIIVLDNGVPSFKKLQERSHLKDTSKINYMVKNNPVVFICFDILYDKKDLTKLPLLERKKYLDKYKDTDVFIKTKFTENDGIKLFNAVKEMNLEGIVAKEKSSTYLINERSNKWLKIKNLKDDDFYICGYYAKEENNVASLVLGKKENNKYKFVSNVTIGKRNKDYKKIISSKTKPNYMEDFSEKNYIFIEPKLKCTVCFLEKTKNGHLRHPIFKCLKDN